MALAAWLRERLWRASSWPGELVQLRAVVAAEPRTAKSLERTFDLARATDDCDPDRGRALAQYLDVCRGGLAAARPRAKALAIELRADVTLAELALADGDLMTAGAAYLDAGFPELAAEPLRTFVAKRPAGASVATEVLRIEGATELLAIADHKHVDVARAIDQALVRATHATGAAVAIAYVHAARLARLGKLDARLPSILAAAQRACPDDAAIAALLESRLFDANNADGLLEHYRGRFERASARVDYVERMRAAGLELIARNQQPAAGLRFLRMSLEQAYDALLPEVTSHIATWELVVAHARAQHTLRELVPLIVRAMAAPVSDDVAVYLARLGLEIVWRDAGDMLAAQPYAATLLDFVPDHPLAVAFANEIEPGSVALPSSTPPPSAPPPKSSAMPGMVPLAKPAPMATAVAPVVAPPPPVAPAKPVSRIPTVEQGPVKRVPVDAAIAKPTKISGRLALLQPPPPRTTTLRRDASPIPAAPQAAGPPAPRAPRTIMPVDAVVELPNGEFFSTMLRDVSTTGAFVVTKRPLEIGTVIALDLEIPMVGTVRVSNHRTSARIARRTDVGVGLAFVEPPTELVAAIDANTRAQGS